MRLKWLLFFVATGIFLFPLSGWTEEKAYTIVIKDHVFSPAEIKVPANKRIKIIIENQDPTAEEFESFDLNREKVVVGKGKITIFVGPLKPGIYKYFGEFNPKTAQGKIIAE